MLLLKVAEHVCETVAIVHTVPLFIFCSSFVEILGLLLNFFPPVFGQVLLDLKSL
jgi:hypothetical protein